MPSSLLRLLACEVDLAYLREGISAETERAEEDLRALEVEVAEVQSKRKVVGRVVVKMLPHELFENENWGYLIASGERIPGTI